MNFTITEIGLTVQKCTDWCVQQHFANDYKYMWLIFIATLSLMIAIFIDRNAESLIKKSGDAFKMRDRLSFIGSSCMYVSFLLLAAFIFFWKYYS